MRALLITLVKVRSRQSLRLVVVAAPYKIRHDAADLLVSLADAAVRIDAGVLGKHGNVAARFADVAHPSRPTKRPERKTGPKAPALLHAITQIAGSPLTMISIRLIICTQRGT
jgi:hypothetical protein